MCAEGLELLESLLGKTNATAASDFGVACLSLRAGMQGAWLNVCINTGSLHDAAFAAGARAAGRSCSIPAFRAPTAATRRCWLRAVKNDAGIPAFMQE
ncbi:MAG: cyclodeaminase/cyclohydrolase family protein [Acutalibacteraceae bacterium]